MKRLPMSASIYQIIKVEAIKYLLGEPYASAAKIATALNRPVHRVTKVFKSSEFLADVKGNYALRGEVATTENTAA